MEDERPSMLHHALRRLAEGAALAEVLEILAESMVGRVPSLMCSISLVDESGKRLVHRASRNLPPAFLRSTDGLEIGPNMDGSWSAAFTGERTIVADVGTSPLVRQHRALARASGIAACWFEPIRGSARDTLGVVGVFYESPRVPMRRDVEIVESVSQMAGVAIELDRNAAALRDRETRMATILNGVVDGIITIDARGTIELFNRAAEGLFGYGADEVVGKNVNVLMPSPHREHHDEYLARYARTGHRRLMIGPRELVGRRKDGSTFPIDVAISELVTGGQRKFTGIVRDVSERKRLEAEALAAQKLEAIGRLAASVAHDFNNVLMGIIGCNSLAISEIEPGSSARVYIEHANAAAARGASLTRQLLDFSNRRSDDARPMAVNSVIEATEVLVRRLVGENIELVVRTSPSGGYVKADPGHIEQVLMNLVVNGRDAMPTGGRLEIEASDRYLDADYVRAHVDVAEGPHVVLSVMDTGVGMDDETRARAFEPFFTTKGPERGTGLGLSTVYGIAKRYGGHVTIDSALGAGTTVRLFLPEHGRPEPEAAEDLERSVGGTETVLLVDDDALVRNGVCYFLEQLGYEVRQASSAKEAIALCDRADNRFALLLTDLAMPEVDGLELAMKLSARDPSIRVLCMSGLQHDSARQELERDGFFCIAKPFTQHALGTKIRDVFHAPPPAQHSGE